MTAENSGKFAFGRMWGALKVLRDQWMVAAFVATTLFWARDAIVAYVGLPARVTAQEERVDGLTQEVARLSGTDKGADRTLALHFPGAAHTVEDGRPGERVMVTLSPILQLRSDCRGTGLVAFVVDQRRQWHRVRVGIGQLPQVEGVGEVRFSLDLPQDAAPGLAHLVVQVTQDCGDHRQVEQLPKLLFHILPEQRTP